MSNKLIYSQCYGQMAQERFAVGWDAFLLTFMFNPLNIGPKRMNQLMQEEVAKTYSKILSRMHRVTRKVDVYHLPLWISAPDFPVAKYQKGSIRDAKTNDGLHFHVIAVVPPENPRGLDFEAYIKDNPEKFRGHNRYLQNLDIVRITHDPDYVADYVMKSVKRGWVSPDDILILPESHSERPTRTGTERKQAKIDGEARRRYPPKQ